MGLISSWHGRLAAAAITAAMSLGFLVAPANLSVANAAPVVGFNPGNIISDGLFYDGQALSAAGVQTFLDQRVPRCTIGDSGRAPGAAYGNGHVASECLRNFTATTISKPASAYCNAYAGRSNESGAQIIARVGQACGISQKVLLVMLEKEQSLVSDSWPLRRQFDVAMGYACPDSGPNYSANCDPTQIGFFNQVYRAAWQLKVYKAHPNSYNYKPIQTNTIQWNPSPGCGTSKVHIENSATAALYIYTPYRPNQAALNAGWGTGDSCSSYGNRNFYNFYKGWFGPPVASTIVVHDKFKDVYNADPGVFGAALSDARTVNGTSVEQRFVRGTLYWDPVNGVSSTKGAIRSLYENLGGPTGKIGLPRSNEIAGDGWVKQNFQYGVAYWSNATGVSMVSGGMMTRYVALGGPASVLGLPRGVEWPEASGAMQQFQLGTMFWTPETSVTWTIGGIGSEHARLNGVNGKLGFPLTPEATELDWVVQEFFGGRVYWTRESGSVALYGDIYRDFLEAGGPTGTYGLPKGSEVVHGDGVRQVFENGTAYWRAGVGVGFLQGGIGAAYLAQGGTASVLGFPVGRESSDDGWARQTFQRGTGHWSEKTSVLFTKGAIHDAHVAQGGVEGPLGNPITSEIAIPGGVRQEFEGATAYWSSGTGVGLVHGAIRANYLSLGGHSSYLGFPLGGEIAGLGWMRQEYRNGTAYWSPGTGVVNTRGAIRAAHIAQGGVTAWGFPLTSEIAEPGGVRQEFEKGTTRWSSNTGVEFTRR